MLFILDIPIQFHKALPCKSPVNQIHVLKPSKMELSGLKKSVPDGFLF